MPLKPISFGPFLRGVHAETDVYTQPKGSVPRASNLIMSDRGALITCDGSSIINWFNGVIASGSGRFMSIFLFEPTGVNPYYLAIKKAVDKPLGAPAALALALHSGGSLTSGQKYFYVVTAFDGAGGETSASVEESITPSGGNLSVTLTWNIVPNALGYNVYRGTASSGELLLIGSSTAVLPVIQPSPLTKTVSFVDDGTTSAVPVTFTITTAIAFANSTLGQLSLTTQPNSNLVGLTGKITGNSRSLFNRTVGIAAVGTMDMVVRLGSEQLFEVTGTGGTITVGGIPPPVTDTTQQTALFQMPGGQIPISYSDANIDALFPASLDQLGGVPAGGTGGGGTSGDGITGQGNSSPSGGVAGLVSMIPQMVQFTNRVAIALGNGFAPQLYSDASTLVNRAGSGLIASVSVSHDQVTVTFPASITITANNLPVGSNLILSEMTDSSYNGVFPVIAVTTGAGGTATVRNPTASGGASTGAFTISTTPITNTFLPAYPPWAASSQYAVNSIIQPNAIPETYYFKAIQQGESGATEPTWTQAAVLGQQIADGTIIWENQGAIQASAPAPPGAGHITVYAGSLWIENTFPTNTSSGLDGPCSLRMCDVNNPISWNPINQAFLDKDDGTEGMGLATFTISAQGIPPEGSLVAFKNYAGYQIVGVFGSTNFSIQRIRSDMGCFAPRSIWFVPGYGIARYAHLGVALFDGVQDTIISEEQRPYLFPSNNADNSDLTVADANWIPVSQGCLTANPPMYVLAIPIGNSGGQLTRILNYDLVLKCWGGPIDLPFPISSMSQVRSVTSNPITIFGGFSDGTLQRWQAGDEEWYTGSSSATDVTCAVTSPEAFGNPQDQKLHWRRLAIRGVSDGATSIAVTPYVNGKAKPVRNYAIPSSGDFEVFCGPQLEGLRFRAVISFTGNLEISRLDFQVVPKHVGVPLVIS